MKTPHRPRHTNSNVPGIAGFVLAALFACTTLAFAAQVSPSVQASPSAQASVSAGPRTIAEEAGPERGVSGAGVLVLDAAIPAGDSGDLPPVLFDHDAHVTALAARGLDCTSCHEPSSSKADGGAILDYSFGKKGVEKPDRNGTDYAALKEFYHDGCIGCHDGMRGKDIPSGPIEAECRACHAATPSLLDEAGSRRADGGFDPALHYLHANSPAVTALAGNGEEVCAVCHHSAEELSSPLLDYDSCRSCHGTAEKERAGRPFSVAAHESCISCHIGSIASGRAPDAPLLCESCHDPALRDASAAEAVRDGKVPEILPRLNSGQPNVVLMAGLPGAAPGGQRDGMVGNRPGDADAGGMPPVAFDHTRHEKAVPGCVSCHHDTLASCSSCHEPAHELAHELTGTGTGTGAAPGSGAGSAPSLYQAMHDASAANSCVGCHEQIKTSLTDCMGCHTTQPVSAQPDCAFCHTPLPAHLSLPAPTSPPLAHASPPGVPEGAPEGATDGGVTREQRDELAAAMVASRRAAHAAPGFSGVPEVVSIGILSNEFEPAEFPHGRIVRALARGIGENTPGFLATHMTDYTLCQSCHHNSPASPTPPSCVSCHAVAYDPGALSSGAPPGLMAAYHQQCMSCHQRMEIPSPADADCTACHSPRAPAS